VATAVGYQICTSADSGITWVPRDNTRNWYSVASSSDGTKLVAGVYGGQIYTSNFQKVLQTIGGARSIAEFVFAGNGEWLNASLSGSLLPY